MKALPATALLGKLPARPHTSLSPAKPHASLSPARTHVSPSPGQLAGHQDMPQPHAPGKLLPCLVSSSSSRAQSHCLHQQIKTDLQNPQSMFWLVWERGIILDCLGLGEVGSGSQHFMIYFWINISGIWPALPCSSLQLGTSLCFLKSLRNISGIRLRGPAVKCDTSHACPQLIHWKSQLDLLEKNLEVKLSQPLGSH